MNQYSLADAMTDKYVCVSFTKVSLCVFVPTVIWPLFTAKPEDDVVSGDYTPFTFLAMFPGCFGASGARHRI